MSESKLSEVLVEILKSGDLISDFEFDEILPAHLRDVSETQWSSIRAARVIADMLKEIGGARFIDLGCGVGKLCLALSLMTDLEIFGIERRANLVRIARRLAETNAPGRVSILQGDILDLDWNAYDVFFLFNPFFEHKCDKNNESLIDRNIELGEAPFDKCVDGVFRRLCYLKPGQKVITYYGYGGPMPKSLRLVESVKVDRGTIKLWEPDRRDRT